MVSIVDRFLEHSRIYYFLNGGEDEVYLASADWMTRNLDKRDRADVPGRGRRAQERGCIDALRAMFRDTVKARWLGADGVYRRRRPRSRRDAFRAQEYLQHQAARLAKAAKGTGVTFHPEQRDQ